MKSEASLKYSIVVPFFNEQENIPPLYMKLTEVMDALGESYELIFVDDGSRDNTFKVLSDIYEHDHRVNIVRLRRNFGQTAGLKAGFDFARGEIIISMDGDLQHDPEEIPRFLEKNRRRLRPGERLALRAAGSLVDAAATEPRGQLDDGQAVGHRSA